MKKLIVVVLIFIFALLQVSILNRVSFFNVKPDLLLIGVIMSSIFFSAGWAIFFSGLAGALKDIACVNTFGFYTMFFVISSFLIVKLSRKISFDNDYVKLALVVVVVMVNDIVIRMTFIFLGNSISLGIFIRTALLDSLYTAAVFILVLGLARHYSLVSE